MKYLFFVVLFIFSGGTVVDAAVDGVLSGRAVPGSKVILQFNRGMVHTEAEAKAGSSGNFSLNWPFSRPGIYNLVVDNVQGEVAVFVKPGWKVKADVSGGKVVFGGDGTKENQFLQLLKAKQTELSGKYPPPMSDAVAYKTATLNQLAGLEKFIGNYTGQDADFTGTLKAYLAVGAYLSLLKYPFISQVINQGKTVVLPEGYYDFLPRIDLTSPYFANLGNTGSFLQEVFTVMESEGVLQAGLTDYLARRAAELKDPVVREDYLLYALKIELFGYNQHLGRMMPQLESMITTPSGRVQLKEIKAKYAVQAAENAYLNAGRAAVDFGGMDPSGKTHLLSDYKGKVVVVDVWNTGCKPCIAEMPCLRKLEQKFAGKDVVFISLSLESGVDRWRKFLSEREMHGNQWIETAAFKSPFAKAYHVRFVPRFMVFSRDGKIVETYAPRPSDPRLEVLISKELEK